MVIFSINLKGTRSIKLVSKLWRNVKLKEKHSFNIHVESTLLLLLFIIIIIVLNDE